MSYKVDYGAIQNLYGSYSNAVSTWSKGISSVMQRELAIEATANISGNSASRMRQYLSTTYSCAKDMLSMLLNLFERGYLLYTQAYYQQIDASGDTCIDEAELGNLRSKLQDRRSQLQQISIEAENTAAGVADLVSLPRLDISEADAQLGHILTSLDELDNAVNGLERAYSTSADLAELDAMISRLEAFFREMIGLSKEFKTSFTAESFMTLASVPALIAEAHRAQALMEGRESEVSVAIRELEKRLEQEQAEYEKRQEQAKWAKVGVSVVTGAIATVAIAATGGTAAPFVGFIKGTVDSAFSAMADEYVAHGFETSEWDVGRIGGNAIVGGIAGFLVGQFLPEGTGTLAKSGFKSLTSGLSGAVTEAYDQATTSGTISDWGSITQEFAVRAGGSFVGSMIGSGISGLVKDSLIFGTSLGKGFVSDPAGLSHTAATVAIGGVTEISTSIIKRGVQDITEQAIRNPGETLDLSQTAERMFDVSEVVQDGLSGGANAGIEDYYEWRTPDWQNTANSPEEILQLKKMEQNGELEIPETNPNLADPEHSQPHLPSSSGVFSGERGNSAFYPDNQDALDLMRTYGQDHVDYKEDNPDFSPFTKQDSPWGPLDCQVEIGHMTDQRQNPTWEYGKRPAGASHDPNYDLGNFAQADNALLEKIRVDNPNATLADVRNFIESNHLTWHECADGKTMQLVPTEIHDAARHSGGVSEMKYRMAWGDITRPDE